VGNGYSTVGTSGPCIAVDLDRARSSCWCSKLVATAALLLARAPARRRVVTPTRFLVRGGRLAVGHGIHALGCTARSPAPFACGEWSAWSRFLGRRTQAPLMAILMIFEIDLSFRSYCR